MATWQDVRNRLHEVKVQADKGDLVDFAGGIRTERLQSDKLGSDFVNVYVNDILVRQEYVEQDVVQGTAENPIHYTDGVYMIPNAYYAKDGVRKVYMGQPGTITDWDDPMLVEF